MISVAVQRESSLLHSEAALVTLAGVNRFTAGFTRLFGCAYRMRRAAGAGIWVLASHRLLKDSTPAVLTVTRSARSWPYQSVPRFSAA